MAGRLTVVGNLALLVLAIFVGIDLGNRRLDPASPDSPEALPIGPPITIPGVRFESAASTLIVVMHDECPPCDASVPYYKVLLGRRNVVRSVQLVVAISGDPERGRGYLLLQGITFDRVVAEPSVISVVGTGPEVILADSQGRIRQRWLGQIDGRITSRILQALQLLAADDQRG